MLQLVDPIPMDRGESSIRTPLSTRAGTERLKEWKADGRSNASHHWSGA